MQWRWIDRFVEFRSGQFAKAEKRVDLGPDFFEKNFPPRPVMPRPLIVEGLAQTGGLLVAEANNFTRAVILAKIPIARFYCDAYEGDLLTYTARLEYVRSEGGMVRTQSHVGQRLQAEADIVFAHVVTGSEGQPPFDPAFFRELTERLGGLECLRRSSQTGPRPPDSRHCCGRDQPR